MINFMHYKQKQRRLFVVNDFDGENFFTVIRTMKNRFQNNWEISTAILLLSSVYLKNGTNRLNGVWLGERLSARRASFSHTHTRTHMLANICMYLSTQHYILLSFSYSSLYVFFPSFFPFFALLALQFRYERFITHSRSLP